MERIGVIAGNAPVTLLHYGCWRAISHAAETTPTGNNHVIIVLQNVIQLKETYSIT